MKSFHELLNDLMLAHEAELDAERQQMQQQLQQQMQQQVQQMQQQVQQMQMQMQQMQQHYQGEITRLQGVIQEHERNAGAGGTGRSPGGAVELEVELEVDGIFYLAELEILPVSAVNIYEVTPGMVIPMEETTWASGQLKRGQGLDQKAYALIESAINNEVRERLSRLQR